MPSKDKLKQVFGEQFVKEYQTALAKKRAEKDRMTPEEAIEFIKTIANQGFNPVTPSVEIEKNTAMLVEMPSNEETIERQTRTLDGGAVSKTVLFCGNWVSCLFNDPALAGKLKAGEFYVILGRYYEQDKADGLGKFLNMQAKGLASLDEFEKMIAAAKAGKKIDTAPLFK